ncbi:hypothetical protein BBAD15_g7868 [Beauveria bassiana D1-5]|uniref:Uncharacterized protein n=1 Tax=Beauveria bassiana D1-5 TaxID=1245745 RepID=A0A0A2VG16_BEABA|nr:hypothetical protein BBAD15_g7868 [Beauveria bassiana D1-5]
MPKRPHSLAMADDMPSHPTPPHLVFSSADWQDSRISSSSHGNSGLHRSKKCCPPGNWHQSTELQSKFRRTLDIEETPIRISSSQSDWSNSPQRLSVKDTAKGDTPFMTLKLTDDLDTNYPPEYWLQCPSQDEALLGCGTWQNDEQHSRTIPHMPFEEVMLSEPSRAAGGGKRSSYNGDQGHGHPRR